MDNQKKGTNEAMPGRRYTSVDVARLAGVSQSSVSRAFTPGAKLSEETRKKILVAARKLGYKPNAIARSLTMQRTNLIGIVMANAYSPFYSQILIDFTNHTQKTGRQVLLFNVEPGQEIDDVLSRVLQYQVDGLVITSATLSSAMADECAKMGIPVVLFNRYELGANVSAVCCDNVEGGRMAANFLLDTGHKNLAYITGPANASTTIDRQKGFEDRLQERGIDKWIVEAGDYSYESGLEAAKKLLSGDNPPDGIFCASDLMALGVMDTARFALNLRVPEDISVIGFDNIPAASWPTYSLTTINQPIAAMVDAALELLGERLEDSSAEHKVKLVGGELVKRNSVRLSR